MIANLSEYLMLLTTKYLIGKVGHEELAATGLAMDLALEIAVISIGFMSVIGVLMAQAEGAGNPDHVRHCTSQGMLLSLCIAIPATFGLWHCSALLNILGQDPAVVTLADPFFRGIAFFVAPLLCFSVLRNLLSAVTSVRIVIVVALLAVVINFFLTRAFLFGDYGFPELGLYGAGLSFSVVHLLMCAALVLYIRVAPALKKYRLFQYFSLVLPDWSLWRDIFRLGIPVACLVMLEAGLFVAVSLLSGMISIEALAAYQIIMAWIGVPFVIAYGFANATMIRVAHGVGRQQPSASRRAGYIGIASGVVLVALLTAIPLQLPHLLVSFFLSPEDEGFSSVSMLVHRLLVLVAFFQVFDAMQVLSAHALRGLKDTVVPIWIAAAGYWMIGIGGGSLLAFHLDKGVDGLWLGLAGGLTVTGILLARRFASLSSTALKIGQTGASMSTEAGRNRDKRHISPE